VIQRHPHMALDRAGPEDQLPHPAANDPVSVHLDGEAWTTAGTARGSRSRSRASGVFGVEVDALRAVLTAREPRTRAIGHLANTLSAPPANVPDRQPACTTRGIHTNLVSEEITIAKPQAASNDVKQRGQHPEPTREPSSGGAPRTLARRSRHLPRLQS
jgi:hypothetical protein